MHISRLRRWVFEKIIRCNNEQNNSKKNGIFANKLVLARDFNLVRQIK